MQKNDRVSAARTIEAMEVVTWHPRSRNIREGTLGRITSVRSLNKINVKFDGQPLVLQVNPRDLVVVDDPAYAAAMAEKEAKKKREAALLEPGEGDILPDDPRLAWLWRKVSKYAKDRNYCPVYDEICDSVGIPGRERDFEMTFTANGLDLSTKIKAMSKATAEAALLAAVPEATKIVVGRSY